MYIIYTYIQVTKKAAPPHPELPLHGAPHGPDRDPDTQPHSLQTYYHLAWYRKLNEENSQWDGKGKLQSQQRMLNLFFVEHTDALHRPMDGWS
mmetsp:Transcript_12886/g.21058  ORF Transcript_12886/g.21058 Transcript_12886/m.21058 type:complete len:93 (-) Transcript_12886:1564-1842(-)